MIKNLTILREEQYKNLANLSLNGKVLDLGGSRKSGYQKIPKGNYKVTIANINPAHGCDMVFDIDKKFPIKDREYGYVICLNVLEHIFNFENVFRETYRVLKKNGTFIFSLPFMHHIHGSPNDYFRLTKSALEKILKENNFKKAKIKSIGFGLFSLIFQTTLDIYPLFLRGPIKRFFTSLDKTLLAGSSRYKRFKNRIPLGYFVIAKK